MKASALRSNLNFGFSGTAPLPSPPALLWSEAVAVEGGGEEVVAEEEEEAFPEAPFLKGSLCRGLLLSSLSNFSLNCFSSSVAFCRDPGTLCRARNASDCCCGDRACVGGDFGGVPEWQAACEDGTAAGIAKEADALFPDES